MINDRETQVVDVEAVVSGLVADTETIESEIQVIKSRAIAGRTGCGLVAPYWTPG